MSAVRTECVYHDGMTLEFEEWAVTHDYKVEIQVRLYSGSWMCKTTFHVPRDTADPKNLPLHIDENDLVRRSLEIFKPQIVEQWWKAKYQMERLGEAVPLVKMTHPDVWLKKFREEVNPCRRCAGTGVVPKDSPEGEPFMSCVECTACVCCPDDVSTCGNKDCSLS